VTSTVYRHFEEHPRPVFGCDGCIGRADEVPEETRQARRIARSEREQERTTDQHELLAKGLHPATHRPLARNGETCGSCSWFRTNGRKYFKCSHPFGPGVTNGAATDIRKTWPACEMWKAS
jgi:hypothetical protein